MLVLVEVRVRPSRPPSAAALVAGDRPASVSAGSRGSHRTLDTHTDEEHTDRHRHMQVASVSPACWAMQVTERQQMGHGPRCGCPRSGRRPTQSATAVCPG